MTDAQVPVPSRTTVRAVVTRADGTVQDYGIVAASYKNPIKRAAWAVFGSTLANHRIKRMNREAGHG